MGQPQGDRTGQRFERRHRAASSHYNNGKIYEAASQWDDALREYRAAQAEKSNPTYDKAIARMQQNGAK